MTNSHCARCYAAEMSFFFLVKHDMQHLVFFPGTSVGSLSLGSTLKSPVSTFMGTPVPVTIPHQAGKSTSQQSLRSAVESCWVIMHFVLTHCERARSDFVL